MVKLEPFWRTDVPLGGTASVGYPNTTAVGATSVFAGVMGSARIIGSVFADQAGTLTFRWSSDAGTDTDIPDTVINIVASTKTYINVEVRLPFVQVIYTNGAGAQTVFRLYLYITDRLSNLTVT